VHFAWSEESDCAAVTKLDVTREVAPDRGQIFRGTIVVSGPDPIRGLRICAGPACRSLAGGRVIAAGRSESFSLRVPETGRLVLRVRCAVLEPRAVP
jgi:hypothetical protein